MTEFLSLEPIDVLFFRGNQPFGEAGEHGAALLPPWPSVFAGALRSAFLSHRGVSLPHYAAGRVDDHAIRESLGTPQEPGPFRVSQVLMARGTEAVVPLPADVMAFQEGEQVVPSARCRPLAREDLPGCGSHGPLPCLPVARLRERRKPVSGLWLTEEGFRSYLEGRLPAPSQVVRSHALWHIDPRLGIALEASTRTAQEHRLYTTEAVALAHDVRFVVGVQGLGSLAQELPSTVRLGGDGRACVLERFPKWDAALPPWLETLDHLEGASEFTLVLSTPGIFPEGWLPPGLHDHVLSWRGLSARLAAACVGKPQVISGWDLASWKPKPAQMAVPSGSVYFFQSERPLGAQEIEALRTLVEDGLWALFEPGQLDSCLWKQRRAEGFNNVWVGRWPEERQGG